MYFLLEMGIFQPAMLGYQRVHLRKKMTFQNEEPGWMDRLEWKLGNCCDRKTMNDGT